jgi:hypothetical protein
LSILHDVLAKLKAEFEAISTESRSMRIPVTPCQFLNFDGKLRQETRTVSAPFSLAHIALQICISFEHEQEKRINSVRL